MTDQRFNPHDSLFRSLLADADDAASEFRPVVAAHASPEFAGRIDWRHMELQHCSFVDPELSNRYGDLLFRTTLDDRPAFLYVLAEHQSSSDRFMALRMLEYMVNIWWRYLDQEETERTRAREAGEPVPPPPRMLPAIIPLVVHNTATGRAWSAPLQFTDLIDLDAAAKTAIAPYMPQFRFLLDDVSRLGLEALRERDLTPAARTVLVLQQIVPGNDQVVEDILKWLADDLRALEAGPNAARKLQIVISYVMKVGDPDPGKLAAGMAQIGPRAEEATMTLAERLEARGREEGRAEERAAVLIELMTDRFGTLPVATIQRVESASPDQLRAWTKRVLRAQTIEEIFA
ncbi:Rpn family recombination-promoting nuclease/putative transposase [Nocardia sp. BMG51109]|uniref:Rpn family recombination-promoting nuclease/putative transposase n=1 Tax=Nocardia sp. BMG51109 TaxID=1056816 RepID=UPI00046666AF|nr:Rpn family recombination-promoting nuclease/putative transposase [Nocardia sp. BMG51109]